MITPIHYNSFWHLSPTKCSFKQQPLEFSKDKIDKVWVETTHSLVSVGTEILVANGAVPTTLYNSMKVPYMEGNFNFPIKYGYSLVGKVVSKHPVLQNKLVHLLHPHQDNCWVNTADCFPIPQSVSPQQATLASNLETALNAVWDSGVSIGDRVLVVGFGLIGSLIARLLQQIPAVDCYVSDINPAKQQLAKALGFQLWNPMDSMLFDAAFHTSSSSTGLQTCIDKVGFEGKIIELSWYGTKTVQIQFGGDFHTQRKQIISSQVSNLPAVRRSRWDYKRRKQVVFELLKNPIFDQHITHTIPFQNLPKTFHLLKNRTLQPLGLCVEY